MDSEPCRSNFPIVGACTASGMNTGIWLAISKLWIVDRGLLVKHQDILGLFQWSPVCIEKTCSALLVPNPLIAEHGEVGCAQHLVKGALCENSTAPFGLTAHFTASHSSGAAGAHPNNSGLCRRADRSAAYPRYVWAGAQALNAIHEKQALLQDTLSQSAAIGHYGPPLPWQAQAGRRFLFPLVLRPRPSAP